MPKQAETGEGHSSTASDRKELKSSPTFLWGKWTTPREINDPGENGRPRRRTKRKQEKGFERKKGAGGLAHGTVWRPGEGFFLKRVGLEAARCRRTEGMLRKG